MSRPKEVLNMPIVALTLAIKSSQISRKKPDRIFFARFKLGVGVAPAVRCRKETLQTETANTSSNWSGAASVNKNHGV